MVILGVLRVQRGAKGTTGPMAGMAVVIGMGGWVFSALGPAVLRPDYHRAVSAGMTLFFLD
jgi:hypothetical protein